MSLNDSNFFDQVFKNSQIKNILLLGDTVHPEKFAYKIKQLLITKKYNVYEVDKVYANLDLLPVSFDAVILCMHPVKCMKLIKFHLHTLKNVIIQPGAESDDIIEALNFHKIDFTQGCVLKYFNVV